MKNHVFDNGFFGKWIFDTMQDPLSPIVFNAEITFMSIANGSVSIRKAYVKALTQGAIRMSKLNVNYSVSLLEMLSKNMCDIFQPFTIIVLSVDLLKTQVRRT